MEDDIVELNAHEPSVESVVSRLNRFKDKIEHITAVVVWKDESADVFHDSKDIEKVCYESILLNKYAENLIFNTEEDN